MEPHQARLTLFAFLALSGIIVFNALHLQADPGFAARVDSPVGEIAASIETPLMRARRERIVSIRTKLSRLGYFPGGKSGGEDAILAGAIMAYEYDHGLPLNGRVSEDFHFALLSEVKVDSQPGAVDTRSDAAQRLIAEIQGILSGEGHYRGAIDGRHSEALSDAVGRFEQQRGLPVTGRVSGLMVQELTRVTGMRFSAPRD